MHVLTTLGNWLQKMFSTRPTRQGGAAEIAAVPLTPVKKARVKKARAAGSADIKRMEAYASELELSVLPNDLARSLYLASLRDCNSGIYLHPHLSHRLGTAEADRVLRSCHEEVFRSLLRDKLPDYVLQLEAYIGYTGAEKKALISTWKSLEAYRSTVPVTASKVHAELFSLHTSVALRILESKYPGFETDPQTF